MSESFVSVLEEAEVDDTKVSTNVEALAKRSMFSGSRKMRTNDRGFSFTVPANTYTYRSNLESERSRESFVSLVSANSEDFYSARSNLTDKRLA
jgi:hypothetical protein